MYRHAGASGSTELAREQAYLSAEHQAKIFASAFLIHDEDAAKMDNAEAISVEFGVSMQAAEICFERLRKKEERTRSAERVRKIAEETKALLQNPKYLPDPCNACGNETLISIGATKVHCITCGFNGDQLQDGDR